MEGAHARVWRGSLFPHAADGRLLHEPLVKVLETFILAVILCPSSVEYRIIITDTDARGEIICLVLARRGRHD